jgi:2-polyprenyl-3-methyl-5-hydroxy-6-metoxy-1,4-benzoquinol methylase
VAASLCQVETQFPNLGWSKSYYEAPNENLIRMLPKDTRTILSIGCGWGALEEELQKTGMEVTALPLDTIIGASAAERGIRIIYGSFDEGLRNLGTQTFDCVLVPNLLHLQENFEHWLLELGRLVGPRGSLVASGPNFGRLPWMIMRILGIGEFKLLKTFASSGININGPSAIARTLKRVGLNVEALAWLDHKIESKRFRGVQIPLGRMTARNWIIHMKR